MEIYRRRIKKNLKKKGGNFPPFYYLSLSSSNISASFKAATKNVEKHTFLINSHSHPQSGESLGWRRGAEAP